MAKAVTKDTKVITINDLAGEFQTDPRKLRQFIRKLGFRAPKTGIEGFGPRAKYEWPSDSQELKKIREAWKNQDVEEDNVEGGSEK